MKLIITTSIIAAITSGAAFAQVKAPTSFGGAGGVVIQSTKGTRVQSDTTAHTKTESGATVSTSTDQNDGQTPNGGVGEGDNSGEEGK